MFVLESLENPVYVLPRLSHPGFRSFYLFIYFFCPNVFEDSGVQIRMEMGEKQRKRKLDPLLYMSIHWEHLKVELIFLIGCFYVPNLLYLEKYLS